jgi:metallo-beta-lactamase family protein
MPITIRFLGAAGTVTGSKYLVSDGTHNLLIDCGMFQGTRSWREKNWDEPNLPLAEIDAVLLTHAHIDHTGMLPRYHAKGLKAPVWCSPATAELTSLLLIDSGRLQEEEASFRSEHKSSRHTPPLPLYTEEQAKSAVALLKPTPINISTSIAPGITAQWSLMGHILGACSITLTIGGKHIVFSGDIGRYDQPILVDPRPAELGDLLLIESTYGNRFHDVEHDPHEQLAAIINRTTLRGGVVVIPSFAVGRTQTILYYLRELKAAKRIADIPVIIDSPMARDATSIYQRHTNEYDAATLALLKKGFQPFNLPKMYFTRERAESIKLNSIREPMIIISASGMLSGGRILHHLKHRVSDERNTILFVGFQPPGSRGDWLKRGHKTMTLLGEEVTVRAEVCEMSGLSAHGDRNELLRWCRSCTGTPGKVAIVHGETDAAHAFGATLKHELGWSTCVPAYDDIITI